MSRKPPKGKSLAELNAVLSKEWHASKNGDLSPYDLTAGSHKKVWWKCDKGEDHVWLASIKNRSNETGCPVCSGKKVVNSNSIATLNPALANEWHPTKNGELTPYKVSTGTHKKVWWKCDKGEDHVWLASVCNRSNERGCPVCSGKKVVNSNCLSTLNPVLAKEWHPTKNGILTPHDISEFSNKKVWWKCDKGEDHVWLASVCNRSNERGCPVCSGKKVVNSNCLANVSTKLTREWHPTKNGDLTPYDVTSKSGKRVWWKCDKGEDHEWISQINGRLKGGCPICHGLKVVESNCLATTNHGLAKEWHTLKNGDLTPYDVTPGSGKNVWWKCPNGEDHEWMATIASRNYGNKCPICSGHKTVRSNSLGVLNPDLAKEWHPTKNGKLTPFDLAVSTAKKIWWKCPNGDDHVWLASTNNRSKGKGCPFCTLTPQSRQELTITFELINFFDINPKGFKTRVDGKLWTIDIYIPELNLGIEFDGNYWHKRKRELDKLKTEKLKKDGFKIMRVRQEPLKPITKIDVISKTPFDGKAVTDEILIHILETYVLDDKKVNKIENYLLKNVIQNEKGLDSYIDMILTEKAEKNNS